MAKTEPDPSASTEIGARATRILADPGVVSSDPITDIDGIVAEMRHTLEKQPETRPTLGPLLHKLLVARGL